MFPYPVYALSGLIAKVPAIEVPAQEEHEAHDCAILETKLSDFRRLLLASLVRVREVASRFRLYKERGAARRGGARHHDGVDWDVDSLDIASIVLLLARHVHMRRKRAGRHL